MLNSESNEKLLSEDEENVPLSRLMDTKLRNKKKKRKQLKQKEIEEMAVKKKTKLEWRSEDCAKSIGKLTKFTGQGEKKKHHYKRFEFRGTQYGLEGSVFLSPEKENQKPYVAIIKDIYIQGKEGYVKLEVQWFYRPEDVEKKHIGNWKSRDLFYSFHRDVVFAESVKHSCTVHFVPENMQIPNRKTHPGFIVQNIYHTDKKKLCKLTDNHDFNEQQKHEIDLLVTKTIARIGDDTPDISGGDRPLPDIANEQKTLISRRKKSIPKRFIPKAETRSSERGTMANQSNYKLILERFDMLTGDSDRDKMLGELLEAIEHGCRVVKMMQDGYNDFVWSNDLVYLVHALEHLAYDSYGKDKPDYNQKLKSLIDKLKDSPLLTRRLVDGELKAEQVIKMTSYELKRSLTFDEMMADVQEPILKTEEC